MHESVKCLCRMLSCPVIAASPSVITLVITRIRRIPACSGAVSWPWLVCGVNLDLSGNKGEQKTT